MLYLSFVFLFLFRHGHTFYRWIRAALILEANLGDLLVRVVQQTANEPLNYFLSLTIRENCKVGDIY